MCVDEGPYKSHVRPQKIYWSYNTQVRSIMTLIGT